jgi:hypothetical protein
MKSKLLNIGLILSSLIGYLEWGQGNHQFLFQSEAEIISKLFTDPISILHPFTILPLLGQILLIITLFQKQPDRIMTYSAIACIGILLLLMFVIGIISMNFKILFSTLPFLILAFITIRHHRMMR